LLGAVSYVSPAEGQPASAPSATPRNKQKQKVRAARGLFSSYCGQILFSLVRTLRPRKRQGLAQGHTASCDQKPGLLASHHESL
jgi:hypothetical protein